MIASLGVLFNKDPWGEPPHPSLSPPLISLPYCVSVVAVGSASGETASPSLALGNSQKLKAKLDIDGEARPGPFRV